MTDFPDLWWVRQDLTGPRVDDPAVRTAEALASIDLVERAKPGQSVAVAVGSRGITNLSTIVRAVVGHLRGLGLEPFVVPAMGSHGGGSAHGQTEVLAGFGITEAGVGCPINASMDVVDLATSALGFPVLFDRLASEADHVVVINRIKTHTMFDGTVESGLLKMLMIGLGKQAGASVYHRAAADHAWQAIVDDVVPRVMSRVSVLAGVAIVENGADETARIEAFRAQDIASGEPGLLDLSKTLMPKVPFDDVDVLLIDQIGKNISGAGFDPSAVGRKSSVHEAPHDIVPRVRTIIVRGLTPETQGNALGVGLSELCRNRVIDQMDRQKTWLNAITAGDHAAGMLPIHFESDGDLLDACSTTSGLRDLESARICWIRNTLDLGVVGCSAALLDDARRKGLDVIGGPVAMTLDADGNLPDRLPDPPQSTG